MVGEDVEVEHGPAPPGDPSQSSDTVELPAATYEKLRRLAAEYLRSERAGHTLQPTALLHEAFLRVLKRPDNAWRSETHVIAFAARAMRRILISYGVARTRDKRGGPSVLRLPLMKLLIFCVERDPTSLQWMRRLRNSNLRTLGKHKLLSCDFSRVSLSMIDPLLRYRVRR
jgi:hypothetical protein